MSKTAEQALAEYMDAHPWGSWANDADYLTCDFCGMGDNEPEHLHHSEDCPVYILWKTVRERDEARRELAEVRGNGAGAGMPGVARTDGDENGN